MIMLSALNIKHFAIIDESEISFDQGFTVITGETGAGKSVLINALSLVLGGRGRTEVIRTGADSAEVEALFDLSSLPHVKARLRVLELDAGDELVIRRVISRSGRSRAYVNSTMVTLRALADLTDGLVDISGQHEHYSLLQPERHLDLLDRVGGIIKRRQRLESVHEQVVALDARIGNIHQMRVGRQERAEFLRFQLAELISAELDDPEEEATLEAEARRLRHVERLRETVLLSEESLDGSSHSALEGVRSAIRSVGAAAELDPELQAVLRDLETASVLLEESARGLGVYGRDLSGDPERLEQIESRLALFQRLRRKYGVSLGEVITKQRQLEGELEELTFSDGDMDVLVANRASLAAELFRLAERLSAARRKAGDQFGRAVSKQLSELGMGGAQMVVSLEPVSVGVETNGGCVGLRGLDRVEFMLSANQGETPQSLGKVASGGELSRIMLAVKQIIAEKDPVATYIFDEVDAGVGGATAEEIGVKLRRVGGERQAICITHLPQIAALGGAHFRVEKTQTAGRTRSEIRRLSVAERTEEIARMLGGRLLTDKTRLHAEEMLSLGAAA